MQSKRVFSHDPTTGVTKWFHYDDDTEQVVIETTQNVDAVLEDAKRSFNSYGKMARWGDGDRVAHIPAAVYAKWCAEGKLGDQTTIRNWINDPANKHFRTRPGRV
jgi:hypothetical protein